ncbi:hypothetical protein CLV43_11413 [Umezawaea tangerina]|uniref:Uncharacterized protein n=1 Tax=Umezawaea tangerina TaxID=84725 RepID=A0A2T0SNW0_9PSEU|nr:hypothetical protein CLV43_11413 [Umezawaea tangerina]
MVVAHVNPYGTYEFPVAAEFARQGSVRSATGQRVEPR